MADSNSRARSAGLSANNFFAPVRRQVSNAADAYSTALSLGLNRQENRVAVRDFVGGLFGNDSNAVATALTAPRSSSAMGDGSVTVAMPKARPAVADDAPLTPQERQLAYLDTMFKKPLSMRQAVALTGLLPAPGKAPSVKDVRLSQAAEASNMLYSQAIAAAQQEPDTAKAQALFKSASKEHYRRMLAEGGGNPNSLGVDYGSDEE